MLVLFLNPIASTHIFAIPISHLISTNAAFRIWCHYDLNRKYKQNRKTTRCEKFLRQECNAIKLPDCSWCSPLTTITFPLLPDATRLFFIKIAKHPRQFRTHQNYFRAKFISSMSAKFHKSVGNFWHLVASDYANVQIAPNEGKENIY